MNRSLFRTSIALVAVAALALPVFAKDDALSLVPANAVTVGMVKLGQMRTSPLSSVLFEHTDKMSTDGEAQRFIAETGLSPAKDIDVLVVATSPRTNLGSEADVVVFAEGRFNVEKLTSALTARGAVKKGAYLLMPESKDSDNDGKHDAAVAFPTASLAIAGTERAVAAALEARANGGTGFRSASPLAMDLARVDTKATAWALVDVTRAARLAKGGSINTGKGQTGDALAAAIKSVSTLALWATDTGDTLELGGFGVSGDAETLQLLEDTARGALSALRLAVKDKAPDMVAVLRKFDVSRKDNYVQIEGSIPAGTLRELMAKKRASVQK
ncbi:MAG TPA: hypothetical protein VEU30_05690 [Thermoanaerobaculia bacterium]|nr:hypothetical protein [Thermoanaerobaculia bacterium]